MSFVDRTLTCRDCGAAFVFSAREQEYYESRGFQNDPARCPDCRAARKAERRGPPEMTEVVCAGCGAVTEVPFKPTGIRPVYCRSCFGARGA